MSAGGVSPTGLRAETYPVTRMERLRQDWGRPYEIEDCGDYVRARRRGPLGEWITAAGAGYLRKAIEADNAGHPVPDEAAL